ncbi:MAG: Sensor protein TorS [Pseudidiomarina mangrovi]|nr:MAG: Sensor protein TorS [Pseudidiomarina mangrovi]
MTQAQANILIVEDDFISREVLKAMLTCYEVTVHCAENAHQAITMAAQQQFALALLDHELPDSTGIALYQQLTTYQPGLMAALVSSHPVEQLAHAATAVGMTKVLSKPLDPQQLADLLGVAGCI